MSGELMHPVDFSRWAKNLDCYTWKDFAFNCYSLMMISELIQEWWRKNKSSYPMRGDQLGGWVDTLAPLQAGLQLMQSWEPIISWRANHRSDVSRITTAIERERWNILFDLLSPK